MPPTTPPSEQWFQNQIAQLKADVAALKAQRTQYVLDPSGTLQAIIGNVATDQNGNATGYSGWGLLSKQAKNAGWTAVVGGVGFVNSWANQGGAFETAAFLKDALGFVHLKGVITGGSSNTTAFTLPAGYRPGATGLYGVADGGALGAVAYLQIASGGGVAPVWNGAGSFIGLSGITFLAEN